MQPPLAEVLPPDIDEEHDIPLLKIIGRKVGVVKDNNQGPITLVNLCINI